MISLMPSKDNAQITELFKKHGLEIDDFSGCVIAVEKGELIGYCLYRLDSKSMMIFDIYPQDDIPLADGILRSTLHVAAENFVLDTFYADTAPIKLFQMLDFIKNEDEKRLNIDKLFGGCSCKK